MYVQEIDKKRQEQKIETTIVTINIILWLKNGLYKCMPLKSHRYDIGIS